MKKLFILTPYLIFVSTNIFAQLSLLVSKNEKAIVQILSYDEFGLPYSSGTGFFINSDGTGFTNLHVLENAKYAFVRDINKNVFPINRINRICKECDIAEFVIEYDGKRKFEFLDLTDDIPLKGSDIFVIGNPKGLESSVSTGIVSSIRDQKNKIIQISAPISPGSSGSPIMDINGKVFGIATFQYSEGQNLNFGYWIGCRENLITNSEYTLSNSSSDNLFITNRVSDRTKALILNSIERTSKNTILNFTFTHTSLGFGGKAFIFSNIGDRETSFYIEDRKKNKRYYAYDTTIGRSAKNPTYIELGEPKKFKIYFPPIEDANEIDIKEGMDGGDWSFSNIILSNYSNLPFIDNSSLNDFNYKTALYLLSSKKISEAYQVLKNISLDNMNDDFIYNLRGVVSYMLGNYMDSYLDVKNAIKINPINDNYYYNLCYINYKSSNFDEALNNISSAIQLNNNQPEYYSLRGDIFIKMKMWKEAIKDYNKYIESDRSISYHTFFQRAIAKFYIQDKSACLDLKRAYTLSQNENNKKAIANWYNKYCK